MVEKLGSLKNVPDKIYLAVSVGALAILALKHYDKLSESQKHFVAGGAMTLALGAEIAQYVMDFKNYGTDKDSK